MLYVFKGSWSGKSFLSKKAVDQISASLSETEDAKNSYRLFQNMGNAFQGSNLLGKGFIISETKAHELLQKDTAYSDVLFQIANWDEINSLSINPLTRWVVNFKDWDLEKAISFPLALEILEKKVRPEREKIKPTNSMARQRRKLWWKFTSPTVELYRSIEELRFAFAFGQVSEYHALSIVRNDIVFSHRVIVVASDSLLVFCNLQSSIHEVWVRRPGSTTHGKAGTSTYFVRASFDTFPRLLADESSELLDSIGNRYIECRQALMQTRQEGLTKTYNHFHDPTCTDPDIQTLRDLHRQMDQAVATAYGWQDLDLDHGFHETKQGLRYTISEPARREVLDRLLALNHQRYAEEKAQGLHDKKKKKKTTRKRKAKTQAPAATPEPAPQPASEDNPVQGSLF